MLVSTSISATYYFRSFRSHRISAERLSVRPFLDSSLSPAAHSITSKINKKFRIICDFILKNFKIKLNTWVKSLMRSSFSDNFRIRSLPSRSAIRTSGHDLSWAIFGCWKLAHETWWRKLGLFLPICIIFLNNLWNLKSIYFNEKEKLP